MNNIHPKNPSNNQRGIGVVGLLVALTLIGVSGVAYWHFVLKAPMPFLATEQSSVTDPVKAP